MFRRGKIEKISGGRIQVSLESPDFSISSANPQYGRKYSAKNKKNFFLKEGELVTLLFSDFSNGIRGIFAFLFPIVAAFAGFFLAPKIAVFFKSEASETFKSICSGALFLFASATVCFLSRSGLWLEHPEIVGIYKKDEK